MNHGNTKSRFRKLCVALCYSVMTLFLFAACHYSRPDLSAEGMSDKTKDSLIYLFERHYTYNTNLEVQTDSVVLERLPVKDSFVSLHRGDRVVVAEFAVHPADSVDSVWVKLAHSQEIQGWMRETELIKSFVPTDSISQFIYLFSDTHASYFVIVFALFVAVFYLLGLTSCCIFCYFFFILTTHIYIGYLFLFYFVWLFAKKLRKSSRYKYRCGRCGGKLREKGVCPHCGAINE